MAELNPKCPECGGATSERKSNIPGITRWWGCLSFPRCRGKVREYAESRVKLQARDSSGIVKEAPWMETRQNLWDQAKAKEEPRPVEPQAAFVPSPMQAAIFEWIEKGKGHGVIEAVAGSGKTTTILQALSRCKGKVLFCAFGNAIAKELGRRAPEHVTVSTLHSLGRRAVVKATKALIDEKGKKLEEIIKRLDQRGGDREWLGLVKKAVSLAKATLTDASDFHALSEMLERYGIEVEVDEVPGLVALIPQVLDECKKQVNLIDFDDMIWLPVVTGLKPETFDWVFIDEAQDLNRSQIELALRACKKGGRIVAVGDRHQSIYGFRGADTEAIPNIISRLKAKVMPLSITYRCPASHVKLAQMLVPAIQASPSAKEGEIRESTLEKAMQEMADKDMVLCRVNAPLATIAFGLIRAGKKAVIMGRDIATGLAALMKKCSKEGPDVRVMLLRLSEYEQAEVGKLLDAEKEAQAEALRDKCETIRVICEGCSLLEEALAKLDILFSDTAAGVVCSSVHKAKGLEAERVFIHRPELMPHPSAKRVWETEQEHNIRYVALTRSKHTMVFIRQ